MATEVDLGGGGEFFNQSVETEGMQYLSAAAESSGLFAARKVLPELTGSKSLLENFGEFSETGYRLRSTNVLQCNMYLAPEEPELDLHKLSSRLRDFVAGATDGMKTLTADGYQGSANFSKRKRLLWPAFSEIREQRGALKNLNEIKLDLDLIDRENAQYDDRQIPLYVLTRLILFPTAKLAREAGEIDNGEKVLELHERKWKAARKALQLSQDITALKPQLV